MYFLHNPREFEEDKRFFEKRQHADLIRYLEEKYKLDANKLEIVEENITAGFINAGTNLYNKSVKYKNWTDSDWCIKYKKALNMVDKYKRLSGKSGVYCYLNEAQTPEFLPFHASDFVDFYLDSKKGYILKIRKKVNQFYDFFIFYNGVFYKHEGTWETVKEVGSWQKTSKYEKLPFFCTGGVATSCPVVRAEKRLVTGVSYGSASLLLQFGKLLYGSSNLSKEEWRQLASSFSIWTIPNLGLDDAGNPSNKIGSIDLGSGEVPQKWTNLINNSLRRLATTEGVDTQMFMPENKIESGISRLIQQLHVKTFREDNILFFKDFDYNCQDWLLVNNLIKDKSFPFFENFEIIESKSEKAEAEAKRLANIFKKYEFGAITKKEAVAEINKTSIEDAEKKLQEVRSEKLHDEY